MLFAEDHVREKAISHKSALALAPQDPWILSDIAETYEDLGIVKWPFNTPCKASDGYSVVDLQRQPTLHALLDDPAFGPA
jgi:hypothetical protein